MSKVYDFLESNRGEAYSLTELVNHFALPSQDAQAITPFIRASVERLVGVGALGYAIVRDETYYAFQQAVEKGTWRTLAPF